MNRLVWKRRGPEMIAGIVAATLLGFAVALLAGASPSAAGAGDVGTIREFAGHADIRTTAI